jgi:hypothetical protein
VLCCIRGSSLRNSNASNNDKKILGFLPFVDRVRHWELLCTYLYTYEVPVRGVQTEVVTKWENVINPGFANFLKCIIERSI